MSRSSPFPAVRVAVAHAVTHALAALAVAAGLLLGPALVSVVQATSTSTPATATVPPVTPDPASMGTNPFIPEDVNIGDCISSVQRPDCGSDQRSGYHQYLTFIILFLATVFIGWRVAHGVHARDHAVNDPVEKAERPTKV